MELFDASFIKSENAKNDCAPTKSDSIGSYGNTAASFRFGTIGAFNWFNLHSNFMYVCPTPYCNSFEMSIISTRVNKLSNRVSVVTVLFNNVTIAGIVELVISLKFKDIVMGV